MNASLAECIAANLSGTVFDATGDSRAGNLLFMLVGTFRFFPQVDWVKTHEHLLMNFY